MKKIAAAVCLTVLLNVFLLAQAPATGMPPFQSLDHGTLDTVNLGNLNFHFAVPVLHKNGRGIPFDFDLTYDSSIWYPVTSGSTKMWEPVSGWGWQTQTNAVTGYILPPTVTTRSLNCFQNGRNHTSYLTTTTYRGFVDPQGTYHHAGGSFYSLYPGCSIFMLPPNTFSGAADDGSGYTMSVSVGASSGTITSRGGKTETVPVGNTGGAGTVQDSNGNKLTTTNGTTFNDTLDGNTADPVLTISGNTTSSLVYSYPAPTGLSGTVQLNYSQETVCTHFGVTGISEYPPTQVYLVSSITMPDGSSYQIQYENVPSPPSGCTGAVTGRIAQITLPTGGTISYTYNGVNNGIFADGTTSGFTRTEQSAAGNYTSAVTYSRTQGSPGTTTISNALGTTNLTLEPDANSKSTGYFYETQRVVKDTSGSVLETVDTCYNGNVTESACNSTAVSSPITQTTQWTTIGSKKSERNTLYNSYGLVTELDEYDFGAGSPTRQTKINYDTALTNGIVDRPSSVNVYDGSGTLVSSTTYGYDAGSVTATSGTPQLAAVTGSRGNVTSISQTTGTTTLTKSFTYYDTGNVASATDVNGATTNYSYANCGNSFLSSISLPPVNGNTLTTMYSWNCTGGVETSTTDANGTTTAISYSGQIYWRPSSIADGQSSTDFFYYSPNESGTQVAFNNGNSVVTVFSVLDGLGRPWLTQKKESPGSSNFDTVQTDYDVLGRAYRTSLPFQSALSTGATNPNGSWTQYDILGRPLAVSDSGGGSTAISYTGNDVYQSIGPAPGSENPKRKQLEYNGLGQLTSVCEVTSASGSGSCGQSQSQVGFLTAYGYSVLGQLTNVTQGTQTRAFTYDSLEAVS